MRMSCIMKSRRGSVSLKPVEEVPRYLVTHYVPKNWMDHEARVRTRQILDESGASFDAEYEAGRVRTFLCAACSNCCSDCAESGPAARKQALADNVRFLFDQFLEPVDGTAAWDSVKLEILRMDHAAVTLVSECREHTLETWLFHNMESCCIGFVYKGPTDFIVRPQLL